MTFRIGQRVRIVRVGAEFSYLYGKEAVVISSLEPGGFGPEHRIAVDGTPPPPNRDAWAACPDCLEPVQPERNQVTTWAALADLWQPEHLREKVNG